LDQSELASRVNLSRSSISRILSGAQEPKLLLAYKLAEALGVTLDYLVAESPDIGPTDQLVMMSADELTILKLVRRLGTEVAMDRLLNVAPGITVEERISSAAPVPRHRGESSREDKSRIE
jgi:transcriptional regulator with XRE-family HTH domain